MLTSNVINTVKQAVANYKYKFPLPVILALVEKESNGIFLWTVDTGGSGKFNIPIFRPESHKFYKYLTGTKRATAIKQRLASAKAGGVGVPANSQARYIMLERMFDIDREAALMSISMGAGQVMGFHYKRLGYTNVEDMWQAAHSISGQINMMLRFLDTDPSLRVAIEAEDVKTIAKLYNGPAYAKNNYDKDLTRYIARYRSQVYKEMPVVPVVPTTDYKKLLNNLGFISYAEFQTQYALNPDGILGPLTKQALIDATEKAKTEANRPVRQASTVAIAGASVTGIGVLADNANTIATVGRPILDAASSLADYSSNVLLVGGVLVALAAVVAVVYMKWIK